MGETGMSEERHELTVLLQCSLAEYGYTEVAEGPVDDVPFVVRIMTPFEKKPQYVCAVVQAPSDVTDIEQVKALLARVRDSVAGQAPPAGWKDRGTYVVLLCSHALYEALSGREGGLIDRTGLHKNILLGICLLDMEALESSGASTWGLFHSGKHYGAMKASVVHWCTAQRKAED
jgi:hypothetical protein